MLFKYLHLICFLQHINTVQLFPNGTLLYDSYRSALAFCSASKQQVSVRDREGSPLYIEEASVLRHSLQ